MPSWICTMPQGNIHGEKTVTTAKKRLALICSTPCITTGVSQAELSMGKKIPKTVSTNKKHLQSKCVNWLFCCCHHASFLLTTWRHRHGQEELEKDQSDIWSCLSGAFYPLHLPSWITKDSGSQRLLQWSYTNLKVQIHQRLHPQFLSHTMLTHLLSYLWLLCQSQLGVCKFTT